MERGWVQNRHQTGPKWCQDGAKVDPKWGQDGGKNKKDNDRNIKPNTYHPVAPFWKKKSPSWVQVRPQNGATIAKKEGSKINAFLDAWLKASWDGF